MLIVSVVFGEKLPKTAMQPKIGKISSVTTGNRNDRRRKSNGEGEKWLTVNISRKL